ncbi:zinc ABC transporter substrate-binding protein [Rhodoferax sp.]|uniref:metal ABC transporter solute-binding protein, Zn/Mn family n=1 Tax=Rhodoferax sp. TaxID=50421 RepID=UPI002621662F|nr:zinc ABC transporter substrate-binding protein [Rhodoferax sp.]MDD3938003.1 zinc ABC transporter substrate-binding protein [Rhodoferax sp.]
MAAIAKLIAFVVALWALQAGAASASAPLPVFVSILPQKYFVERVGGEQVVVSVMVGPGQSPATYEPTPRQMTALSQAKLYFSIGVAFEDTWMKRIQAATPALRVVPMQRGIALLPLTGPGGEAAGTDPHIWTSPLRVKIMAASIRDALIETDPAHRGDYELNYRAFIAELDALDRDVRALLMSAKGKSFLVFHPSWGYFANDYGLRQIPIEAEGKEPGAKALVRVIDLGKREGARVIFVQTQFSRRTAETVAAAIGARVVGVDPLAENYPQNLLRVAHEFAEALK